MNHLIEFLRCKLGRKFLLERLPLDARDLGVADLGWGEYSPKASRVLITNTLGIKSQRNNTCTFNSRAAGKEMDEGVKLSVACIVKKAVEWGLVSKDGLANLRTSELVVQKFGICTDDLLPENRNISWEDYSAPSGISQAMADNAATHKSASFWNITNRYQVWKALDEGRTVRMGSVWRTSLNGLKAPYILDFNEGIVVGGHAYLIAGYDRNYNGQDVFICQNSFSENYGDKGRHYIKVADAERWIQEFGAFCDLDLPKDLGKWLKEFTGRAVKDSSNPKDANKVDVYLIENGKKRLFKDVASLYAHGVLDESIVDDEGNMLSQLPTGEPMDFWSGSNVTTIKALILRAPHLKSLFSTYFSELFV